jgi:hypothetical protein
LEPFTPIDETEVFINNKTSNGVHNGVRKHKQSITESIDANTASSHLQPNSNGFSNYTQQSRRQSFLPISDMPRKYVFIN